MDWQQEISTRQFARSLLATEIYLEITKYFDNISRRRRQKCQIIISNTVSSHARTTDTQWRHKSNKSENLGQYGRQNITDKRTDVWSRPSCIYTQIFSPKKVVFHVFGVKKNSKHFFDFFFIKRLLCNFSVQTL